jgi:hypothetical protein
MFRRKKKVTNSCNLPEETDDVVAIEDIHIPDEFKRTNCRDEKIRKAVEYYIANGCFDKPISVSAVVNERGKPNELMLVNEYSRLLAAQRLYVTHLPIKYIMIS